MDNRVNNKGTVGNKGGRRPKEDRQALAEKLDPLEPEAFKALSDGLNNKEAWAVRLFFGYMYGKPRETTDLSVNHVEQPLFEIDMSTWK